MKLFPLSPLVTYGGIVTIAAIAVVLLVNDGSFEKKDLAAGLFALFGTFIGALLAFRLEQGKEQTRDERARKAALNRALLVLGVHHNEIRTYRDLLLPFKHPFELAFNLDALQPADVGMHQKFDELDFLLQSSTPNVLFELIIEQARFDQAMEAVKLRNEFFVRKIQPTMAALGLTGRMVSVQELEAKLGDYLFGGAMQGAGMVREQIDASNESVPAMAKKLRAVAKELFPDERFVEFTTVALPNEAMSAVSG
jgi:hypothetical protein